MNKQRQQAYINNASAIATNDESLDVREGRLVGLMLAALAELGAHELASTLATIKFHMIVKENQKHVTEYTKVEGNDTDRSGEIGQETGDEKENRRDYYADDSDKPYFSL